MMAPRQGGQRRVRRRCVGIERMHSSQGELLKHAAAEVGSSIPRPLKCKCIRLIMPTIVEFPIPFYLHTNGGVRAMGDTRTPTGPPRRVSCIWSLRAIRSLNERAHEKYRAGTILSVRRSGTAAVAEPSDGSRLIEKQAKRISDRRGWDTIVLTPVLSPSNGSGDNPTQLRSASSALL